MRLSLNACWRRGVAPLFQISLCTLGYFYASSEILLAQVTSDNTVNTQINQNGNVSEITGGQTRGSNLFHSFQDFSVGTGNEAFFNNANDISNIFSRVTGGNVSNIDGLIRANGSASLFLINPAGIIFGNNARLDLGGSFYGSSASSILFEDGEFSAADLANPPLLTINAPIGLGFRDEPGDIVNNSVANSGRGLEVNPGNSISLLGGNVNFNGGTITAPGGIINLGGLAATGEISLNENIDFSFPEAIERGDISLTNQSAVNVRADGGGFININGRNVTLSEQSELFAGIAENMGSPTAQAGDITINATESVRLLGQPRQAPLDIELLTIERDTGTGIRNNVGLSSVRRNDDNSQSSAIGNGGNISLTGAELNLTNNSRIIADTSGRSASENDISTAGNIDINVTGDINLDNSNQIQSQTRGGAIGNAGNITINTDGSLFSTNGNLILADSQAKGDGGSITITAGEEILLEGLSEGGLPSQIVAGLTRENAEGMGGTIEINASELVLDDLAFISSNTVSNSIGAAGNITINADNLSLMNNSFVNAFTANDSNSGSITINAQTLDLDSGGKILAATDGGGDAGNINLNVSEQIRIDNSTVSSAEFVDFGEGSQLLNDLQDSSSGIYANATENALGNGGNVNIGMSSGQAPRNFIVSNSGQIIVNSEGEGSGGNIFLRSQALELDNNATISASTEFGQGGVITLEIADDLTLDNNATISAQAFNNANGGNLDIDARFIVAFPDGNNDIIANAEQGQGGNITINAESLFGIQERSLNDSTNDIDASSEFNLDGTVNINTPDLNPIQGATELPQNVVETEQTTAQACNADRQAVGQNSLILKGKGGIPASPDLPLDSHNIAINGEINSASKIPQPVETSIGKIQPARGIKVTESGEIILTAYRTNNAGDRIPEINPNCS